MLRLILKPTLGVVALAAVLLGLLRARPYDGSDLSALLVPPSSCAQPCWQGIEIGVTTREQATQILENHPWVAKVYQTSIATTWHWNGRQPPEYSSDRDGLLQIGGDIVRQIRIQTSIPFGDVWLLLSGPDDARLVQPLSQFSAYQIAAYNVGFQVISSMECPVQPFDFWEAPISYGMGQLWPTEALNGRNFNIYHQASWWRRLRYC